MLHLPCQWFAFGFAAFPHKPANCTGRNFTIDEIPARRLYGTMVAAVEATGAAIDATEVEDFGV